jgi:hypothetical protein
MKKSLVFLISVYSLCLLSACGGAGAPPLPATHFSLTAPATATAGTAFNFTVTARDAMNNVASSYAGTVQFTSSDSHAVLSPNSPMTNGVGNFSATLKTGGSQTIKATDTVTASITGTSNPISVGSNAATHFSVTAPASVQVGISFSFTVTALDAANNAAVSYSGTAHFTSSDGQAVLPANSTIANGTASFSATFQTDGSQTIKATDTVTASITGSSNVISVFNQCRKAGQQCSALPSQQCCVGLDCVAQGDRTYCLGGGPAVEASRFTAACTMKTERESHSITSLASGLVLITGGDARNISLATAELFNAETQSFAPTGDMVSPRARHSATLLEGGAVLVTGGRDSDANALATAELFNPANGSFAPTGSMSTARESHTATLLSNGKVLITGGVDGTASLATAELFDPARGIFAPVGSMGTPRGFQTATLLKNGKVLVTGGRDSDGNALATAEVFDPGSRRFTSAGTMHGAREFHTATLLSNGKVLITGGENGTESLATAELFDPASGKFTPTGDMHEARESHTATLRNDGTVLVAGGANFTSVGADDAGPGFRAEPTATAELFDPASGTFTPTSDMAIARARHAAILLPDGEVLVTGGINNSMDTNSLESAELFQ